MTLVCPGVGHRWVPGTNHVPVCPNCRRSFVAIGVDRPQLNPSRRGEWLGRVGAHEPPRAEYPPGTENQMWFEDVRPGEIETKDLVNEKTNRGPKDEPSLGFKVFTSLFLFLVVTVVGLTVWQVIT